MHLFPSLFIADEISIDIEIVRDKGPNSRASVPRILDTRANIEIFSAGDIEDLNVPYSRTKTIRAYKIRYVFVYLYRFLTTFSIQDSLHSSRDSPILLNAT